MTIVKLCYLKDDGNNSLHPLNMCCCFNIHTFIYYITSGSTFIDIFFLVSLLSDLRLDEGLISGDLPPSTQTLKGSRPLVLTENRL